MPAVKRLPIDQGPVPDAVWYRFAAGLCFLEAFYHLNVDGRWLSSLVQSAVPGPRSSAYLSFQVSMQLRPVLFAALGLALWNQGRSMRLLFWLTVGICVAQIGSIGYLKAASVVGVSMARPITASSIRLWMPIGRSAIEQLPWFLLGLAGYWQHKHRYRAHEVHRHPWRNCAAIWFGAQALVAVLLVISPPWTKQIVPLPRGMRPLSAILTSAMLASASLALFWGWSRVRLLVVAGCMLSVIGSVYWDLRLYEGLLIQEGVRPWLLVWLRCCMPGCVLASGQWMLTAHFLNRAPSLYVSIKNPSARQRYCDRCHYSLYGLESNRCPECGHGFDDLDTVPKP